MMLEHWFPFFRLAINNRLLMFKVRQFIIVGAAAQVGFGTSESERSQGGAILANEIRAGREQGETNEWRGSQCCTGRLEG